MFMFGIENLDEWPEGFPSSGSLHITNGQQVNIACGITYVYDEIIIDAGGILNITGTGWCLIGCIGNCINNGTIQAISNSSNGATFNSNKINQFGGTGAAITYNIVTISGGSGGAGGGGHNGGSGGSSGQDGNNGTNAGRGYGFGGQFPGGSGEIAGYNSDAADYTGGGGGAAGACGSGIWMQVNGALSGNGQFLANGQTAGNGGQGGTPANSGGGGGGAGGSGGKIILDVYVNSFTGAHNVGASIGGDGGPNGGGGGNPGNSGSNGNAGSFAINVI